MASTINASNSGSGGLISTGDNSGVLALQTASTTAITVDASQNVGIGTSSPQAKLQVAGDIVTNISQAFNWNMYSSGGDKYIANGYAFQTYFDGSGNWRLLNAPSNSSGAGAACTTTERMRIDSSGNLLVGTTNTGLTNANAFAFQPASAGSAYANHVNGSASGNGYIFFGYNGGSIGSITQNGTTAVAYNTSSDYRLKENIAPLTGALNKVSQLKPVTYTWKSAPDETGEGFIAHELAEVCPQAVHGTKDKVDADGNPVYQGIDTSFLVATLTAAIQELKAINDTQAKTINALTARIVALEQKGTV